MRKLIIYLLNVNRVVFELGNESPKHSSTTFVLDRLNQ